MINTPLRQKQIGKAVALSLLLGLGLWIVLLLAGANSLSKVEAGMYIIQIGPLNLTSLTKELVDNSLVVGFTLGSGFGWYILVFALLGVALGYLLHRKHASYAASEG